MATYTSFLHLEKPTTSERLDVLKINSNWDLIDAGVSALNSQIGKIHYIDTSLASDKNTAVKRLHDKWSTFAAYMATKRSSGIFCFEGFITFPAYGSGIELGTYYVYGSFNVANSQGTVFITQYHADDVWIYKNHGSSASAIKISGTSVDVT